LSSLLSATSPTSVISDPSPTSSVSLTATTVTKAPIIPSIHAFNTQLSIGGKDEALRKAADLFTAEAESMERGRVKGEKYWANALKIRKSNWGLIPAPLPYGSATGKGADRTSKDFLVSFGLEECMLSVHFHIVVYLVNVL
jgi:mediator of RNA polymerase II transcription subunit 17